MAIEIIPAVPAQRFYVCDVCGKREPGAELLRMCPGWTKTTHALTEDESPWAITDPAFYWSQEAWLTCSLECTRMLINSGVRRDGTMMPNWRYDADVGA